MLTPITWLAAAAPAGVDRAAVLDDRLVVFAGSLLVGGVAIHAAATQFGAAVEYGDAVLTALLGAVAWSVFDGIPLVEGLVALAAWVAVIKWRYPVGWLRAGLVGVGAWAVATVVLAGLALLGLGSLDALGVPGA